MLQAKVNFSKETMDTSIFVNQCLNDIDLALQSLEPLCQQEAPSQEVEKCRKSLSALRASLIERTKRRAPLKWLDLPTGIYNPLRRAGYHTIESVACLTSAQILAIPLIGTFYKDKILRALENWHREPKTLSPEDLHFEL